jgi:Na+/melibiose symporter-like transporter
MLAFVILFSILMPLSLVWAAAKAPLHGSEAERVAAPPLSLGAVLRSVVGNKPFLIFFAITTIAGIATGMSTGLTFLYVQDYLKLGNYFFVLGILPAAAAILSTPFWLWLSRHLDKSRAWGVGLLLSAVLGLPILLFAPGIASLGPLLAVVGITSAMQGVTIALPPSVLADIADYEAWKQNTKAAGNYFSILVLLSKVTTAVGSSAALALSGALGYVPRAQGGTGHVMALLIALVVVPTLLTACAAILAFRFPLNRRRLAIIARRLRQREERSLRTQG